MPPTSRNDVIQGRHTSLPAQEPPTPNPTPRHGRYSTIPRSSPTEHVPAAAKVMPCQLGAFVQGLLSKGNSGCPYQLTPLAISSSCPPFAVLGQAFPSKPSAVSSAAQLQAEASGLSWNGRR